MAFGSPPDSPRGIGPVIPPGGFNLLTTLVHACRLILMNLMTAETIIRSEMHAHGLTQQGWVFKWDRAKRRYGSACGGSTKTITLSRVLTPLREEKDVRMTIIHEIAHALVGTEHGHNAIWRRQFVSMGGDGKRCSSDGVAQQVAKYVVTCDRGGEVLGHINRMLKSPETRKCRTHMASITITPQR